MCVCVCVCVCLLAVTSYLKINIDLKNIVLPALQLILQVLCLPWFIVVPSP